MALTLIPSGASSLAMARVRPSRPLFAAVYAATRMPPWNESMEAMLMMRPPLLRRTSRRAKSRERAKTDRRFTSITASQSSSLVSSRSARRMMPALLTRMSASPARSKIEATESRSARSASARATPTTFAPASCSASAMAAPRPREAPVTMAVLPSRRNRSKAPQLQSEIFAGIEERNVLRQPAEQLAVVGQQASAHVIAEEIAHQAAEILVARVREEAARVGDHADESREQTHVRQRADLRRHAVDLIEEPPRGAVLHLS